MEAVWNKRDFGTRRKLHPYSSVMLNAYQRMHDSEAHPPQVLATVHAGLASASIGTAKTENANKHPLRRKSLP